ncbi:ATP-binding cassette domain-containing protein [Vibrio sinaloensis]|nr:ATP-binding cassette domain-containing protein [Vibrio sinaloensis]
MRFKDKLILKSAMEAARYRRSQFGFVFQRFNLIPVMSAWEKCCLSINVKWFFFTQGAKRKKAQEILDRVGLADVIHHRPDNLSGGQQQRVAIARALVHQPQMVIADEPTASLDSKTAASVVDMMKQLGHEMGTTFIVATHDARMATHCDRTINLVDGVISEEALKWAS